MNGKFELLEKAQHERQKLADCKKFSAATSQTATPRTNIGIKKTQACQTFIK